MILSQQHIIYTNEIIKYFIDIHNAIIYGGVIRDYKIRSEQYKDIDIYIQNRLYCKLLNFDLLLTQIEKDFINKGYKIVRGEVFPKNEYNARRRGSITLYKDDFETNIDVNVDKNSIQFCDFDVNSLYMDKTYEIKTYSKLPLNTIINNIKSKKFIILNENGLPFNGHQHTECIQVRCIINGVEQNYGRSVLIERIKKMIGRNWICLNPIDSKELECNNHQCLRSSIRYINYEKINQLKHIADYLNSLIYTNIDALNDNMSRLDNVNATIECLATEIESHQI